MNKKHWYLFYVMLIILFSFLLLPFNFSKAFDPIDDPNSFKPNNITQGDTQIITDKANQIIGAIVTVGVVISAVCLGILGIKYMIGSVEERAEYKKSMIPYIIGSVLLFATSSIIGVIAKLMEGIQ